MPRQGITNYESPTIKHISGYHHSTFKLLCFYNSDRKIKVNPVDFTVSEDNSKSALTIVKAGQRFKGFGLELENVSESLTRAGMDVYVNLLYLIFAKAGFDEDFFRTEEDCTVDAECVTQIFSKTWLRNHYKCFKAMYELFNEFHISTSSSRCGMHVNFDLANLGESHEKQIENARKLGYVINKHYALMRVAFARGRETSYCRQMSTDMDFWKNTSLDRFYNDHGCSYNLGHIRQNRVEIRLVGGQRNYVCFRNTMETVFHIIDRVCKLSWTDLDDVTKLFKGCNHHVFNRLSDDCLRNGVITSEDVETIRATVKDERFL